MKFEGAVAMADVLVLEYTLSMAYKKLVRYGQASENR